MVLLGLVNLYNFGFGVIGYYIRYKADTVKLGGCMRKLLKNIFLLDGFSEQNRA